MTDISVIIVTWNSEDDLNACVDSVITSSVNLDIQLIIIDNASTDKSFEIANSKSHPKLKTIRNQSNIGYTKAVNQGISLSNGKYILLLNPDTIVSEGCLDKLFSFLSVNPAYGAAAPLMLNEDGTTQHSVRDFPTYWKMFCEFTLLAYIFPRSRSFGGWKMKFFDYSKDSDVPQPMAAGLLISKDVLLGAGNMDERFEMFFNDVDLCKDVYENGFKIRLLKDAEMIHRHGASVKKDRT